MPVAPKIIVREAVTDPSRDALTYRKYLSPFQIEKFTYLFDALFDIQKNQLLEKDDIEALSEKLRQHAGWSKDSEMYKGIADVFRVFYECLVDQVVAEKHASSTDPEIPTWELALKPADENVDPDKISIGLTQWLNMWGRMCYRSAGMADFPIWVQLLPNIFFDVIDLDKDGELKFHEMKHFYKNFVGIPDDRVDKVAEEGYRVLTAAGQYLLTRNNYLFCFSNFLLGRTIYGPGKYIFGVFDNEEIGKPFKVIYNVEDAE